MKRRVFARLVLCSVVLLTTGAMAQMPPHPQLLDRIQKGLVPTPSILEDLGSLRARGIDAAWTSPSRQLQAQSLATGKITRLFGPAAPPAGSFKALAILVSFSDKPAQVSAAFFDTLLFVQRSGSMRNYYNAVSYNTLDIITVNLPSSLDWSSAPQPYAYYVNGNYGMGSYPKNSQKLVEDLVALVNPYVDFSQYDNDGDGFVDALFIIHAGAGAEFTGATTDIWSHAWVTQNVPQVDGVSVLHYSIEPEYWQTAGDMTIGVYAHELGHAAFGLPDLYDRDYSSNGLGRWSLMAGGSWNGPAPGGAFPALPDAWSHAQMGFISPTIVSASVTERPCEAVETTPRAFALWSGGSVGSEYFLVENRQRTGYDSYLPGSGLLIYHVDESVGTQNDDEWYPGQTANGHYLVALEQADGNYQLERNANNGDAGDPYPGGTDNHAFSAATGPGSMDYAFQASRVSIRNISTSGSTMTADFAVDATDAGLTLLTPYGGQVWKGGTSQLITWAAVNVTGNISFDFSADDGATWSPITTISGVASSSVSGTSLALDAAPGSLSPASASVHAAAGSPAGVQGIGSFAWTVPEVASSHCMVRLTSAQDPTLRDSSHSHFTITPSTGQWSIQFNWDASAVTGGSGNAGVLFIPTLNEFWTSRWNSNLLHRWRRDGTLIGAFSVTGVSGVRGMAFDGAYVYASTASTTIQIIDPSSRTKIGTLTSPVTARYIAFDPSADSRNGGFWVGDFGTNPTLISRSGNALRSLVYSSLGSISNYGAAFDNISAGGPYLWFWGQGNGSGMPQALVQVSVATGLPTGVSHDVVTDVGAGAGLSLAGGLFFSTGVVVGKATLGGILQGTPNLLFGYEIADAPLPIQLASFAGNILTDGVVKLTWTTLSEVDNVGFEVQKRADSTQDFVTIENSFVPGNGTSADQHYYSFTDSSGLPGYRYRLEQIDSSGAVHFSDPIVPSSAMSVEQDIGPTSFRLDQNYPNPFNPSTIIKYTVGGMRDLGPGARGVSLVVYDVLGREVAVLVNEKKAPGSYQVLFDGSGLASGVYIYRLVAGSSVETKRMLLLK
jgi:immune inhibitor A